MNWKIQNISDVDVKVAVAKTNTITNGVILKPGQFCVCDSRLTSSLDAQRRRNFISINEDYSNDYKLNLCEAYNESDISDAEKAAKGYMKK